MAFTRPLTRPRHTGFTLIELLVVISILSLLIGILLPALSGARRLAWQMQGTTQVRGIIQDMVIYAQTNNHYYPGVNEAGKTASKNLTAGPYTAPAPTDVTTQTQYPYALLLNDNYLSPDYLISPGETNADIQANVGTTANPVAVTAGAVNDSQTGYSFNLIEYFEEDEKAHRGGMAGFIQQQRRDPQRPWPLGARQQRSRCGRNRRRADHHQHLDAHHHRGQHQPPGLARHNGLQRRPRGVRFQRRAGHQHLCSNHHHRRQYFPGTRRQRHPSNAFLVYSEP